MLSDELQRFLNEINNVIFTVCKKGIFMNSGLKVLPKGLRCSILSKITARMLTFRDQTAYVTCCADVTLFLHAMSGGLSQTAAFFLHISCISLL